MVGSLSFLGRKRTRRVRLIVYTVRSEILIRLRNLDIFEVFGVKFSAKKSIFQNCSIKRARSASRKAQHFWTHCRSLVPVVTGTDRGRVVTSITVGSWTSGILKSWIRSLTLNIQIEDSNWRFQFLKILIEKYLFLHFKPSSYTFNNPSLSNIYLPAYFPRFHYFFALRVQLYFVNHDKRVSDFMK